MKYEDNFKGNKDRTLRIYPEWSWMCREERRFRFCSGRAACIKMYPNLICERGFRKKL